MSYSAVPEVNTSDQWSASDHNTYIKDNFAYFKSVTDSLIAGTKPAEGRLTLETGVPVSTSGQEAKTTLYYTPYIGETIALYDGSSAWTLITFAELSLDASGYDADSNYDIFCYNNSGTATLEGVKWTDAATRATALTRQDGVLVKTGATTRRFIGTVRTLSDTNLYDQDNARLIWNMYNRVPRRLFVENPASAAHNYNGAARPWNNSLTNNILFFVIGQAQTIMAQAQTTQKAGADGNYANTFIEYDGATRMTEDIQNYNAQYIAASGVGVTTFAEGYHYIQVYEYGNHASSNFSKFWMSAIVEG